MRAAAIPVRKSSPDAKYGSLRVSKFINYSMRDGKKSVAQKQIYEALELLAGQSKKLPLDVLDEAIDTVSPQMEVRSRRVGGAAYQVPTPVRPARAQSLAIRWLIQEARKRSSKEYHSFGEKLVAEIQDAINNQGGAIARKQASHRMAEANKAFAHFRW